MNNLNKLLLSKKTVIVAEMSANHCQSLKKALKIVDQAKIAGADALKIQTFKPESLSLKNIGNQKAKKINLPIFSSPFDLNAVDFLENLNCPIYKIASPEITDIPLIKKVAMTGKPVILSLGLAEKKDIDLAIKTLKENKCKKFILLKCLAHYPADPELLNLKSIELLKKKYKCDVGFSDHTKGSISAVTAVTLGAKIIEKHFKLKKENKSLDRFFSLDTTQFKEMVQNIRVAERSIGKMTFKIDKKTKKELAGRKSIYIKKTIFKGDKLKESNLAIVRPFNGLHPKYYNFILGKKVKKNLEYGTPLKLSYFK